MSEGPTQTRVLLVTVDLFSCVNAVYGLKDTIIGII